MEQESNEPAERGAPGAAMRDDGAGNLVEREKENDVAGEGRRKQAVIYGVGRKGEERKDCADGAENLRPRRDMRNEEAAQPRTGQCTDDAPGGAGEGVAGARPLHEQCGHADPIARLDSEAAVDLS